MKIKVSMPSSSSIMHYLDHLFVLRILEIQLATLLSTKS